MWMHVRQWALTLACTMIPCIATDSQARCASSTVYQATFEVLSCRNADATARWGVVLDVNVISKTKTGSAADFDWWLLNEPLPRKMHVFYETGNKAACTSLRKETKWTSEMRLLCCDGAEPRCEFSRVQVFNPKNWNK